MVCDNIQDIKKPASHHLVHRGDVKIPLAFIYKKKTHKIVIHNSVTYTELTDRKTLPRGLCDRDKGEFSLILDVTEIEPTTILLLSQSLGCCRF